MAILEETKKINEGYHYFTTVVDAPENKDTGKLKGIAVSVKDCICVKGVEARAGSRILKGYVPPFDATCVQKIKKEGGRIVGKTVQDEFGFGSFTVNVGLDDAVPLNPFDKERCCGGSSGGAAGFTQKAPFRTIALAESTGGSIVAPASFCGVVGLCPTYGRVSRYGLIDYASSLDKIGPMTKNMKDIALVMDIISGRDTKDATSADKKTNFHSFLGKSGKKLKIGIIKEAFSDGVDSKIKKIVRNAIGALPGESEEVSLPLTMKYGIPTYYLLAMSEASTNLAKYCGMRYGQHETLEGNFNDYFTRVRSHHFNHESKRRVLMGTFARMAGYRDKYYLKAAQARTLIIEEYKKVFKKYDALVCPTMPIIAPRFKEIEKLTPLQQYMMDVLTVGPNVAGMPHLSVNAGFVDDMPVGMMVIADHFEEGTLIQLGAHHEE